MWVSRRSWDCLLYRIKKCEDDIRNQKENTESLVRNTAKKILEQPNELHEEIQGIEHIEKYVDEFIGLDKEREVRKMCEPKKVDELIDKVCYRIIEDLSHGELGKTLSEEIKALEDLITARARYY